MEDGEPQTKKRSPPDVLISLRLSFLVSSICSMYIALFGFDHASFYLYSMYITSSCYPVALHDKCLGSPHCILSALFPMSFVITAWQTWGPISEMIVPSSGCVNYLWIFAWDLDEPVFNRKIIFCTVQFVQSNYDNKETLRKWRVGKFSNSSFTFYPGIKWPLWNRTKLITSLFD